MFTLFSPLSLFIRLVLLLLLTLISGCPDDGGDSSTDPDNTDDDSVSHCELNYTELAGSPELPDPDYSLAGALWIAESRGVLKVASATGELLFEIADLSDVRAVALDQQRQHVWVASNAQLSVYQFDGLLIDHIELALTSAPVSMEVNRNDGSLWIANGNFIDHYSDELSLLHTLTTVDVVQTMALDQTEQTLWVAAAASFTQYDHDAVLQQTIDEPAPIVAIAIDQVSNQLWVSTTETLSRYDYLGQQTLTTAIPGLLHLAPSRQQTLWAITPDELLLIDASGAITLQTQPVEDLSFIDSSVALQQVIADDDTATVWVATQDHIRRLDNSAEPLQQLQLSRVPAGATPVCKIEDTALFREPSTDNEAPTITSTPVTTADLGDNYRYQVMAQDADGDKLNFELLNAPPGMIIDAENGLITWTVDSGGDIPVRLQVADGQGKTVIQNFMITVTVVNVAPTITSSPLTNGQIGQPYNYALVASDPNGDPIFYRLVQSPLGMGLAVNEGINSVINWLPVRDGDYPITVAVSDDKGLETIQNFTLSITGEAAVRPVLSPVGNQVAPLGQTLTVQLSARDPNHQPLQFFVGPTPLPAGMSLNANTGEFRFTPALNQVGVHTLTFSVSNGDYLSQETITITVPETDGVTRLSGRVLTLGNQPLPGVRLEINGQETLSDANGNYLLDNLAVSGRVRLLIDGSTVDPGFGDFATVPEMIPIIEGADNLLTPPIYLLPLDTTSADQIQPNKTTIIKSSPFRDVDGNTVAQATMTIPPGAAIDDATGLPYLGDIHISRVTDPSLGPRPLPPEYDLSVYVAIQPFGVTYPQPVPISFPNVERFPPGSRMDFFALNHETGRMEKIGEGLVSADGKTVDSIGGIVKSNSWHGIVPQAPVTTPSGNPNTRTPAASDVNCESCKINKTTGNLAEWHAVPGYRSLAKERNFRIEYNSNTANPHPVFTLSSGFGNQAPPPVSMSMQMTVDGIRLTEDIFSAVRVEPSDIRGQFKITRPALQYDASQFSTGLHDYVLTTQCYFPISRRADTVTGQVMIHNQTDSAIGAGWAIAELQRLHVHESTGKVLLTNGTETLLTFEPSADGPVIDSPVQFVSPSTDYSVLVRNSDGSYSRRMKNGTIYLFDSNGLLTSESDRNGNTTTYRYDGVDRLTRITDTVGESFELSYSAGKLSEVSDPLGRTTRFEHDSRGNLVAVIEPNGDRRNFEYTDNDYLMAAQTDQRGNRKQYTYDANRRVTSSMLPDESRLNFAIGDVNGLPDLSEGKGTRNQPLAAPPLVEEVANSMIDQNGNSTRTEVDANDIPVKYLDSVGRTTHYQRDDNGNITQYTRPNGTEVEQTFDALGNTLTRTERFNGALYQYTYDVFSQLTSYTNPNGNKTTYERDDRGNVTGIVNALGHTIVLKYDSRGLVTQITTPNQLVSTYTYNASGLVETITETLSITPSTTNTDDIADIDDIDIENIRVTTYSYDAAGQTTQLVTPDGITVEMTYDDKGRLIEVRDNLNQTVSYTYDGYNNLVQTDSHNSDGSLALTVQSGFDNRNRLTQLSQPHSGLEQSVQKMILDNNSNIIGVIDPNGNGSSQRYDGEDRLIGNTHSLSGITQYSYDSNDRITRVVAPNGVVTEYSYDQIGRVVAETSADRGTLNYTYDNNNNLLTVTDGRGITTTYTYDELERPISKTFPNTAGTIEDVIYCYDSASNCADIISAQQGSLTSQCVFGIGRLCGIRDESGVTVYNYDTFGNITQMTKTERGITYTTGYQYDKGNHVIQMRYPGGRIVTLERDGLRRVETIDTVINDAPQSVISGIRYRADNHITQSVFGNGLIENRAYDLQGRLLSQRLGSLDNRSYRYDQNGNLLNRTTTPQTSSYQYDALNRLLSDQIDSNPIQAYRYDLNHNRLAKTAGLSREDSANSQEYGYISASNQLAYVEQPASSTTTADNSGETQTDQYKYNNANRWYQLFKGGRLTATYIYNAQGQRTRKVLGGSVENAVITLYHYDLNGQLIAETDGAGTVQKEYIWQGMTPVAQINRRDNADTIHYLHTDHLYTPRFATNDTRQITWRWEGDGFGREPAQDLGAEINLRFPGQYFDRETGSHYNGFRYYDPGVGRYTASDRVGLVGGLNTYGYALQNPLVYVDPTGEVGFLGSAGGAILGFGSSLMGSVSTQGWDALSKYDTWVTASASGLIGGVSGFYGDVTAGLRVTLLRNAALSGAANLAGQTTGLRTDNDPCNNFSYNHGSLAGSIVGGGWAAGITRGAGQVSGTVIGWGPSTASGVLGMELGR